MGEQRRRQSRNASSLTAVVSSPEILLPEAQSFSVAYPLSRSKLTTYIEAAKVFVNGKLITNNGYHLNEGDLISVRGLGRIAYAGILSETKKGRYMISLRKYI